MTELRDIGTLPVGNQVVVPSGCRLDLQGIVGGLLTVNSRTGSSTTVPIAGGSTPSFDGDAVASVTLAALGSNVNAPVVNFAYAVPGSPPTFGASLGGGYDLTPATSNTQVGAPAPIAGMLRVTYKTSGTAGPIKVNGTPYYGPDGSELTAPASASFFTLVLWITKGSQPTITDGSNGAVYWAGLTPS